MEHNWNEISIVKKILYKNFLNVYLLLEHMFMCPTHSEAKQTETSEFGAEKGLLQGQAKSRVGCTPQIPELPEGFQQSIFKGKVREGRGCRLLGAGILCSCSCPRRSGHSVPVNLQQDKCYSLFCNFLFLYEWTLKGQSPENRLSCIFQAIGNILLQKAQSQHD